MICTFNSQCVVLLYTILALWLEYVHKDKIELCKVIGK